MNNLQLALQHADRIENMLIESGGEITPEIQAEMSINPTTITELIDIKYVSLERMESTEDFFKKKAEEYYKISSSLKNAQKFIKDSIKDYMMLNDKEEITGSEYQFKLAGAAPVLEILDESKIGAAYKKDKIEVFTDKKAIIDDLKKGIPVEGCILKENYSLRKSILKGGK